MFNDVSKSFHMLTSLFQLIRSFALIYLCLIMGNLCAKIIPFTIPGSIIGMLLLFLLLSLNIIKDEWVKPGCMLFIRYMALLFIPISVGILDYYQPIAQQAVPIIVSCIASTLITMLVVGGMVHYSYKDKTNTQKLD